MNSSNVLFLLVFASTRAYSPDDFWIDRLVQISAPKVKSACVFQLRSIRNAIRNREKWALALMEASGAYDRFAEGDDFRLGTYSKCRRSSAVDEEDAHQIQVAFFVALFKQTSPTANERARVDTCQRFIHLGLCLPSSCSTEELGPLLSSWSEDFSRTNRMNLTFDMERVRLIRTDFTWIFSNPTALTLGLVTAAVLLLTVSCTFYDVYVRTSDSERTAVEEKIRQSVKLEDSLKIRNIREGSELLDRDNNLNDCYEVKIDNSQHKSMPVHVVKPTEKVRVREERRSFLLRLSTCFSVPVNLAALVRVPETSKDLAIIYVFRFIGTAWLLWLYVTYHVRYLRGDKRLLYSVSGRFSDDLTTRSSFPIDAFFYAGGFLLAYEHAKRSQGCGEVLPNFSIKRKVNEFGLASLLRFFRYAPTYVATMPFLTVSVAVMRRASLFEVDEDVCTKMWWRTLAHINNLFKPEEMCVPWSWYLATDMQFFLVGLLLLILSARFRKFTLLLSVGLVALSSLVTAYYGNLLVKEVQPERRLLDLVYTSPWTRLVPYAVGMFTGVFVVQVKGDLSFKKTTYAIFWTLAGICTAWTLFGLRDKTPDLLATLHFGLSRLTWSLVLSWTSIAYSTSKGTFRVVFEFRAWTIVDKLFCHVYLLGPLITTLLVSGGEIPTRLSTPETVVFFIGCLVVVHVVAFLFSLTFERPVVRLVRQILGRRQPQNQLNRLS